MRYVNARVAPIFDEHGTCIRLIWRCTDLTGQREFEAELEAAERDQRAILDGLSDAIIVTDRDAGGEFRVTYTNPGYSTFTGRPLEAIRGKRIADFVSDADYAVREAALEEAIRERRPTDFEGEKRLPGGRTVYFAARV